MLDLLRTSMGKQTRTTMKQITLISLYGKKNKDFAALIERCQEFVRSAAGVVFAPYDSSQIHGTIIGLELGAASALHNANFAKYRSREVVMDLDGFFNYLRRCGHFPLEVQIGAYDKRDYPFTSRQTIPYERSFSIQNDRIVMMGWPIRGNPSLVTPATPCAWVQEARLYPLTLDVIRHAAQGFGVLHSYHRELNDVDNDLFFRIGLVDPKSLTEQARRALEGEVRQFLSKQVPLVLDLRLDDIFVAVYEDDTLPPSSTQVWPLTDPKVNQEFVLSHLD
jgi:hypothetical protein